jgi:hypothetical protein
MNKGNHELSLQDCEWILKVISLSKNHHGIDFEQAVLTIRKLQKIKEEKTPMFLIQATQGAVIKGKDAILVASLLQRLIKNYENRTQELPPKM